MGGARDGQPHTVYTPTVSERGDPPHSTLPIHICTYPLYFFCPVTEADSVEAGLNSRQRQGAKAAATAGGGGGRGRGPSRRTSAAVSPRLGRWGEETERLTAPEDIAKASALLAGGQLFRNVSASHLAHLASRMTVRRLAPGEEFVAQGAPSTACYVLASGSASRSRVTWDGQRHVVDPAAYGTTINSLHAVRGDAAFASAACASPDGCTAWVLGREELLDALASRPELGVEMVGSLAAQVRAATKRMRTPLLELPPPALSVPAVACAAAVESYYRSALNALLNARLAGGGAARGSLFPNMHVQVPARVAYIVGFKGALGGGSCSRDLEWGGVALLETRW